MIIYALWPFPIFLKPILFDIFTFWFGFFETLIFLLNVAYSINVLLSFECSFCVRVLLSFIKVFWDSCVEHRFEFILMSDDELLSLGSISSISVVLFWDVTSWLKSIVLMNTIAFDSDDSVVIFSDFEFSSTWLLVSIGSMSNDCNDMFFITSVVIRSAVEALWELPWHLFLSTEKFKISLYRARKIFEDWHTFLKLAKASCNDMFFLC